MHIGDPKELLKNNEFQQNYSACCRDKGMVHKEFLGPDDHFKFTCRRTNECCKNFSSTDRIILDPYDVYRLSGRRKISTSKFMRDYAELTLDESTHFPIALLKYKGNNRKNKCHFLRSYGCSVYEDRPLRCRLYPLGRILDKRKSYFMRLANCSCDSHSDGRPWSVQDWINESQAEEYLDYQGLISEIYSRADWASYRDLEREIKMEFGKALYDLDRFLSNKSDDRRPISEGEIMLRLAHWVERFFEDHGCIRRKEESEIDEKSGLLNSLEADIAEKPELQSV